MPCGSTDTAAAPTRERVLAYLVSRATEPPNADLAKYSPRAIAVANLFDTGSFGCLSDKARKVAQILLEGDEMPPVDKTRGYLRPGSLYFSTSNGNSHDYGPKENGADNDFGIAFLAITRDQGMRRDGRRGNSISQNYARLATVEEIEAFVARISDETADYIARNFIK